MRIISFDIQNYKSIKQITVPLNEYGENANNSKVAFFVGLNESGKSTILEAINYLNSNSKYEEIKYENACFKPAYNLDEAIRITANIVIEKQDLKSFMLSNTLPKSLLEKIVVLEAKKALSLKRKEKSFYWKLKLMRIDFTNMLLKREKKQLTGSRYRKKLL